MFMNNLLNISQAMIFLFGASAVWFVGRKEEWRKWGYVCGLLSQPFWFFITIVKGEWFLFSLCLIYAYSWGQGFYNYWIKK